MQPPLNGFPQRLAFGEAEAWAHSPLMERWQWTFSDIPDEALKGTVAEIMVRILLGTDPASLSLEEIEILLANGLSSPPGKPPTCSGTYDA